MPNRVFLSHDPRYEFVGRDDQPTDPIVIREIWCENVYHVTELMLHQEGIVLDLGANIGAFSVYCQYLVPGKEIWAYEPEDHNYILLVENIKKYPNIYAMPEAVGSSKNSVSMSDEGGGSAVNGEGNVPMVTLDSIIETHGEICFLKIDIEGCEGLALLPCTKLDQVRYLAVEYDDSSLTPFGEIMEKLSETHKLTTMGSHNTGCMIYGERY